MTNPVTDNAAASRFELEIDGHIAFADYRRDGGILHIKYVEAPPALRGTGAASQLMAGLMAQARAEGMQVKPICGYAASWLRKHSEYAAMVV